MCSSFRNEAARTYKKSATGFRAAEKKSSECDYIGGRLSEGNQNRLLKIAHRPKSLGYFFLKD